MLTQNVDDIIFEGMIINYTLSPMLGISFPWQTKIEQVQEQHYFVDTQTKGPFKKWRHKHIFMPMGNRTLMIDIVVYELPFRLLGNLAHALIVRKEIENIFKYRFKSLQKTFNLS